MKNKTIIFWLFAFTLFTACDDALDVKPENYLFEEQLVTDDKSAQTSLVGVYTQLNSTYISQYSELLPALMAGELSTTNTGFFRDASLNDFDPNSISVKLFYEVFYDIINSANATISGVLGNDAVSKVEQDRILSEAYFLRAFGHFQVLRYFGQFFDINSPYGIVILKELSTFENRERPRLSVQESYDFILKDLDESIRLNAPFTNNFYASALAAKAFKANVLLYIGGDANYTQAINLANAVINDGSVTLETNFADIFDNGNSNAEVIFSRFADNSASTKTASFYQLQNKASTLIKNYLQNDPRATDSYNSTNSRIKKVYILDLKGGPTNFMRLAELYLIKAECQARLNLLSEAETTLNFVRQRAYGAIPPALTYNNSDELLNLIFEEYVKELCFEAGSVWFSAVRHNKIETVNPNVSSTNQYILPIPLNELESNTLFGAQNPGYDGI
ncbi:RagB/SusD family nutrient uptake outer membrane protein [Oceanihabitans sp. IOP_32]|uniref:RagB/SusD family nutrient uptake outer membrane protein n=1 Tax=Oceanihabitans sp. IOP_32 TaxID=2529032 RepID=UPI001293D0EF|nr:RagB/SusD family nutrient uptake outer membrane protein [Oceanihabitans sp. IOP_32]QFZ55700.1 RagB/SusD family nutrient uptake outer membrane protein [Oceanihabitans sp. IOP_32]